MGKFHRSLALVSVSAFLGAAPALAGEDAPLAPRVPVLFAANAGQWPSAVRFQARAGGMVASVLADRIVLELGGRTLALRFVGAAAGARVEACEPRATRVNFLGASAWSAPTCARVRVAGVWPGVDLELHERDGRIEYDLVLAPGADPSAIALALDGADEAAIDAGGVLCARAGGAEFRQPAPVAWREAGGARVPAACAWRARADGAFGFDVARAAAATLVIDPVLVYGTFVGGSSADEARGVHVDEQGCVYVTGWARSTDFPGAGGNSTGRGKDAVVFKLAPAGGELLFATYLGGRGDDEGVAVTVDESGAVVVAGNTEGGDFPTTPNALDRTAEGGAEGFVVKLAPDGARVLAATLFGGSAEDELAALALTASGQITIAGTTRSRDFPGSDGSYAGSPCGGRDAFVARLDPELQRLLFSARVGGSADDAASALALDDEGSSYVTGRSESHDFPTTVGAFDRERCGTDAFVLKLSPGGRSLVWSTFLGGSGKDEGTGVAVDSKRRPVVVGWTQSLDFPFDPERAVGGRKDGFAVRLSETGNALAWATPLGGGSADEALGVALDPEGAAWVAGRSRSADFGTTADAQQVRLAGAMDAFLARLSADEGAVLHATFLGGPGEDELRALGFDRSGTALAAAGVASDLPAEVRGPLSGRRRGPSDAYVLRIDPRGTRAITPGSAPAAAGVGF